MTCVQVLRILLGSQMHPLRTRLRFMTFLLMVMYDTCKIYQFMLYYFSPLISHLISHFFSSCQSWSRGNYYSNTC